MKAHLALAAAAVALLPSPAFATCTLSRVAELPVTLLRQEALIDARFGVHPARFVLDSGAATSLPPRAMAIELGLKIRPAPNGLRIGGTNGDASAAVAIATDFTLAGIALPNKVFVVGGSDMGATGLIGRDVLGADTGAASRAEKDHRTASRREDRVARLIVGLEPR